MKKTSLVILHGWGLSKERFLPLIKELELAGFAVYAPDLPGFGKSEIPEHPLHLSDYVEFLHRYLKKNSIEQPIFIGHSFGGRLSLKYSYTYPKDVRALILSGTPGFSPVSKKKYIFFSTIAKIGKTIFSLPFLSRVQEQMRRIYYYVVGAKEYTRATGSMRETFKNIVQEDLVVYMDDVKVPCLLLWGNDDTVTPLSIAHHMLEHMKHAKLIVIDNATHSVPYKEPKKFADSVSNFIKTL